MKERGILMKRPLVISMQRGLKRTTRRLVMPQPKHLSPVRAYHRPNGEWAWVLAANGMGSGVTTDGFNCPYGEPGALLYVRETHWQYGTWREYEGEDGKTHRTLERLFPDDHPDRLSGFSFACCTPEAERSNSAQWAWHRRPSIFLPKWASREWLEVTAIRIERIQEITLADIAREGWAHAPKTPDAWLADTDEIKRTGFEWFIRTWDDINLKRGSWHSNPYVWIVDFKRIPVPEVTT